RSVLERKLQRGERGVVNHGHHTESQAAQRPQNSSNTSSGNRTPAGESIASRIVRTVTSWKRRRSSRSSHTPANPRFSRSARVNTPESDDIRLSFEDDEEDCLLLNRSASPIDESEDEAVGPVNSARRNIF
ncbi:hypothetical protein K7432_017074, partial [Basidiobolus ranarum]